MQNVFLELVKLSLIGSLFAAAVMLVRLIFRKAPKWLFCILWGVVALRLICPVSIESDVSLIPDSLATGQIITNVGNEYIGDVDIIYESNTGYNNAIEAGRQPINSDEGYYVVTEQDSLEAPKTVGETVYPILSWVWAVGMVLMFVYTAVSFLVLGKKMEEATHLRDNIWQCEQADSPFVLGFIKPRIYLPYGITDSDMANVIAHEQAHIQRRDHWWKPVGFLLLSIYWFNPVLWLAYILLCRDIEAACDEKVIKHMEKDEMRAYSTALLHCSIHRRRISACPLAFGEVGVKERVKSVMNYKKPAFWIIVTAVISCIVVAVCFMTNPVSNTLNYIEHNDFYAVTQENTTVLISDGETHTYAGAVERDKMQELYDIEISEKEVSQNRSEDRDKTNSLYLNLSSQEEQEILTSYAPGIWIHFNADFTQVWVEDGVKPTLSYKVLKPEQARSVYLSFTNKTTDNEPVETIKGGLKTYYKNADGTWQLNGRTYQYRLEITGRMPNAAVDSTFVYLSNIKSISFARAWRAAGLSSSMEDYFSEEEAVLVDWTSGDSSSETIESDEDYVIKTDRLNGAIAEAILSHNKREKPDGFLNTESHIILVNEAVSGTPLVGQTGHVREVTVYVYYLNMRFNVQGDQPEEHDGIYGSAVITFTVDENGIYTVKHFVKPESSVDSGADYSAELKNKFVAASEDIAENEEKYGKQLLDGCWKNATDYVHNMKSASTAQPGGNPENRIFDSTLSWAGWTGETPIFTGALNSCELTTNHRMHLPVYKFQSKASLDRFIDKHRDTLAMDQSWENVPSFSETAARYTEDFFKDNTLVLVYIATDSISYRYGATGFYCDGTSFVLHIEETTGLEAGDSAVAGWFVTVAVANSLVEDCSVFDAYMYDPLTE